MTENTYLTTLKQKVERRELKVAVVGLGYVGLPLAVRFAEIGFDVTGVDLDKKKVDAINASISYIDDVPTATVAECVKRGKLRATVGPRCTVRSTRSRSACRHRSRSSVTPISRP